MAAVGGRVRATVNGAHDGEVSPGVLTTNRRYSLSQRRISPRNSEAAARVSRRFFAVAYAPSDTPGCVHSPVSVEFRASGSLNQIALSNFQIKFFNENGVGQCCWPFMNTCHATTPRIS